jgi:hypothetical protein
MADIQTNLLAIQLSDRIAEQYRNAVAGRGIAEAELASARAGTTHITVYSALASVRHWQEQVRVLEDARREVTALTRTLGAI